MLSHLKIIRPYGTIGPLETSDTAGIRFGERETSDDKLFAITENIKTLTELTSTAGQDVEQAIGRSNLAVLLGFGFHEQNLKLLGNAGEGYRTGRCEVFATVKGIHNKNHDRLGLVLEHAFSVERKYVRLESMLAAELLSELWPTLLAVAN